MKISKLLLKRKLKGGSLFEKEEDLIEQFKEEPVNIKRNDFNEKIIKKVIKNIVEKPINTRILL